MATAINQTNAVRQSYQSVTVSSSTHFRAALWQPVPGPVERTFKQSGLPCPLRGALAVCPPAATDPVVDGKARFGAVAGRRGLLRSA